MNANGLKLNGLNVTFHSLRTSVNEVFLDLESSAKTGASLFSSSRFDLVAIRALEQTTVELDNIEAWENAQSVKLPWINNLEVQDIMRLRQEAKDALPRFRERMLSMLADADDPKEKSKSIAVLKAEAVELAAEFDALKLPSERRFRNVAGALGITISVYGFAAGFVSEAVALGSLVSLLGLLHTSARKDEQETQKLQSKPAYVLLKAKEIASQHHH